MAIAHSFPGQQPNEKIILILHRHWATLVSDFIRLFGLAILPGIVFAVAQNFLNWDLTNGSLGYIGTVMGAGLYYFFLWNLAFTYWVDYLLDYCVVTDERLVDVQQSGLFHRVVAEQALHRVQDVTTEVKGIFPTMLKYGNLYIQSATEKERFVFEHIANPEEVGKVILALAEQHPQTVIAKPEPPKILEPIIKK